MIWSRVLCKLRGHDMGRWRRIDDTRQRKCRRCGRTQVDMVPPPVKKRPANGGDTVTP